VGLIAGDPVAADSSVFIYFIEEHPTYLPLIEPLFADVQAGKRTLVTSALTLLEVLVVPLRAGNVPLAERYEALIGGAEGVRLVELGRDLLRGAAQLRASLGIRTPDALQVMAALATGCETFVTNDRRLPRVPGLRILQLSELA
jgi:predicted nucleic acid-binding protein